MKNYITAFLLLLVVVLGFQMRMRSVAETIVDTPIRADAREYVLYAYNMKFNHVYSRDNPNNRDHQADAVRPPGYPLFLSIFLDKDISDLSLKKILFAQVMLSTLTIFLTYLVFAKMFENRLVPIAIAFLVAISPHLITVNIYLLSETLFCFLLLLSFYILSTLKTDSRNTIELLFGIALGVAALTRPWLNYFLIIFIIFFALQKFNFLKKKTVVYMAVGYVSIMSIWTIRNLITLGIMSDSGLTINMLHHGMYPYFMYDYLPHSYGFPYRFDPHANQIAASIGSVLSEILHRFKESPLEYIEWYVLGKPVELFAWNNYAQGAGDVYIYPVLQNPYFNVVYFQITHELMRFIYPAILLFFTLSIILIWLPSRMLGVSDASAFLGRSIALLLIYFILVHCIGAPFPRYSIPMLPFIYGMAVFAIFIIMKLLLKGSRIKGMYFLSK